MTEPETVPEWVVTEVGRLHLHALALEREIRRLTAEQKADPDLTPA